MHIVVNNEYASRNNNSFIMRVADVLGNSYICSSDNYFTENPFEHYVWCAYYSTQFSLGNTNEWCVSIGHKNIINKVTIGGSNAWYMIGHVFFDKQFSQTFTRILRAEYNDVRTADKLWEQIYLEHIDELPMVARQYAPDIIFEFDSLDELKDFDPYFLDNLDSEIFDNIVSVLGCEKSEISDVYPLKQGLTNLSCHFACNSGEYVYRHPGIGTEKMLDRNAEVQALELAKRIGLDNTFIYENPQKGWKISKFIKNARELNPHNDLELAQAMTLAYKLHQQDIKLERSFDYYKEGKKYESLLLEKGPVTLPEYEKMANDALRLHELAEADHARHCLTHNDFFNLNLLFDEQGTLSLIDWEYAGMADYASDFGTFVVTCMLSEQEARTALNHYFGRQATPEELRHNFAYVALAGWCWYVWALLKEAEGDNVGDWLYIYYKYAKDYSVKALALYED